MPALYCLFESASGYALLEAVETADLSSLKAEVQAAVTDLAAGTRAFVLHVNAALKR